MTDSTLYRRPSPLDSCGVPPAAIAAYHEAPMRHGELLYWTCVAAWIVWSVYWFAAAGATNRTRTSEGWAGRAQHLLPLVIGFALIFRVGGRWFFGPWFDSTWPRDVG